MTATTRLFGFPSSRETGHIFGSCSRSERFLSAHTSRAAIPKLLEPLAKNAGSIFITSLDASRHLILSIPPFPPI